MEEVNNNPEKQKTSKGRLIPILLVLGVTFFIILVMLQSRRPRELAPRVICGSNLSGLVKSMIIYANHDEYGRFPAADKWCDLLIQGDYTTYKQFVCRRSDAIVGECSYAINKHVAGKGISKLADDLVVLFETNFGRNPVGRQGLLKDRECYKSLPYRKPETKVYKLRWNQVGGPELLTVDNHKGEGCNVAFVSTRVEFVKTKDLGKLKWKPDEEE